MSERRGGSARRLYIGGESAPPRPRAVVGGRLCIRCKLHTLFPKDATPHDRRGAQVIDRPPEARDAKTVADAKLLLDKAYGWLDAHMAGRQWAAGEHFSMADCAAAPSLFCADWAHPIAGALTRARVYRTRLLAQPSVARTVDEARPYRHFFPPGAPDRD